MRQGLLLGVRIEGIFPLCDRSADSLIPLAKTGRSANLMQWVQKRQWMEVLKLIKIKYRHQ